MKKKKKKKLNHSLSLANNIPNDNNKYTNKSIIHYNSIITTHPFPHVIKLLETDM